MKRTRRKKIGCGSEYHLIAKCLKPPKDNYKRLKQVRFDEKVHCAHDNSKNNSYQKIYAYMARKSGNDKFSSRKFR